MSEAFFVKKTSGRARRLLYLCLQATREGQASYAHVREIISGLMRRGWRVELYEPPYRGAPVPPNWWKRLFYFLTVQIKLMRAAKPDVLYIRSHFAAFPAALWAKLRRIPVVQEVNGPYEDLFLAWPFTRHLAGLFRWLIRAQLSWADAIIAVTDELREWVVRETGHKSVYVVPNGANTELFKPGAPLPSTYKVPAAYVVFFGALAPWQGIDIMIEATRHPAWPQEVKLLVLGDGKERIKIEQATHEGRVIYYGVVPYRDVPGIVAASVAGLVPKTSVEGHGKTGLSPLKVFETLACGVPVVVSDFPFMADLVRRHQCGLVIPPGDAGALAEAVRFLYEHPSERTEMGRRGREVVVREHSWDVRAQATEGVLMEVIARRRELI